MTAFTSTKSQDDSDTQLKVKVELAQEENGIEAADELDEEENFLCKIEKQKEDAEETKSHQPITQETVDAPRLLQDALKKESVDHDVSKSYEKENNEIEKVQGDSTTQIVKEEKKEEVNDFKVKVSSRFPAYTDITNMNCATIARCKKLV